MAAVAGDHNSEEAARYRPEPAARKRAWNWADAQVGDWRGDNVLAISDQGDDYACRQGHISTPETAGDEFRFVAPCLTRVDEPRIRDHLQRDRFFWLDLQAAGADELAELGEIFGFRRSLSRPASNSASA